jgi:fermentation-respiration switch protein FrsA (DUF1100 family)
MKKFLKIVLYIVLAIVVIFVGVSAYLGYSMTRVKRVPLTETPAVLNLTYENVTFQSLDNKLTLHGWFLPSTGEPVIIMVHGNGYNRDDPTIGTLDIAGQLVKHGYNVLMFDLRGYGESDGNTVSGGYYEKKDLEGAVVSDSSFADLNDIMGPEFTKRTKAPGFFLHPILYVIKIMYGVDFTAIRPVDAVAEISPRPVFFIHGEADDGIPVAHAYRLFQASQNPQNQLWVVPEAGHTRSFKVQPEEYINKVTAFFDTTLK